MKKIKKEKKEMNKEMSNLKGVLKITIALLIKAIYTLIKNLIYAGYVIIYNFDNLIAKVFNRLPRILRVIAVYSLIIVNIVYFIGLSEKPVKMAENSKIESVQEVAMVVDEKEEFEELEKIETQKEVSEVKEENKKCKLGEIECKIYNNGIGKGMTHKQALLIIAISKHETGNWKSSAFKNKNNFGGIMKNGKLATYKNFDEGLEAFTNLLNNVYFAKGRNTIEKIGAIYCPVGAKNDPNGLNKYWIPKVTQYYNNYVKNF